MRLNKLPQWRDLQIHHEEIGDLQMRELFKADNNRFECFSLHNDRLLLDYSKNRITDKTLPLLVELAKACDLHEWIEKMFCGEKINLTENRAVLHTALRNNSGAPVYVDGIDVMPGITRVRSAMGEFVRAVHSGTRSGYTGKKFSDVVNIGIGGSDLGPAMVCDALRPFRNPSISTHFVSNVSPDHLAETLRLLKPETTLFIVASKTFTTAETMSNAHTARRWLEGQLGNDAVKHHFVALSTNLAAVEKFGIDANNCFGFWDWVGGRYSLWSAIGLSIALSIGMENYESLLDGAGAMDRHFRETPLEANQPVILALLGIWYINFFGAQTQAIIPYSQNLHRFPAHLQQVDMESNGKTTTSDGQPVDWDTGAIVWGEPGTNCQHAFFQLLHQGSRLVPVDFIALANDSYDEPEPHRMLLANCLAQSAALMQGKSYDEVIAELTRSGLSEAEADRLAPHMVHPGNQPSNTIIVDQLDPYTLGGLIALYEHKVFCQGIIWQLCSFDQWGVELGKHLAGRLLPRLHNAGLEPSLDASTQGLISHIHKAQS